MLLVKLIAAHSLQLSVVDLGDNSNYIKITHMFKIKNSRNAEVDGFNLHCPLIAVKK